MAAYYHPHHHGTNTEIQDHNSNNFHTLILMNPNLADAQHHHHQQPPPPQQPPQPQQQPPPPPSSHNILLLNSAATVAATLSPPPPQPFLPNPHHFARPPNNVTLYGYPSHEARDMPRARQGLSLTLSSQNPALGGAPHQGGEGDVAVGGSGLVLGSKFLKPAQELLEEAVDVREDSGNFFKNNSNTPTNTTTNNNNTDNSPKKVNNSSTNNNTSIKGAGDSPSEDRAKHSGDVGSGGGGGGGSGSGGGGGGGGQLSTAERQEIQMKKAKLVTMLDEAEQRYRHYNHQMQIVIESFEQAAGVGSAKTYTALALKTISKQFRCLKDAIQGQIRAANKILGDDHEGGGGSGSSAGGKIEGSRLKYIDHQIRQQRALQQLGMIQNPNAWRPQRGLPERSVSVLRAWLFEHFLHPYPKDSDKIMLAKQTGLTRSQVSNWFINARVRLWKPMIEEMYMEELKEQEQNNGLSEGKLAGNGKENSNNEDNNNNGGSFNHINNQNNVNIAENHQAKSSKDQNNAVVAAAAAANPTSFIGIPTNSATPFKGNNNNNNNGIAQNQHGFTLSSSFEMAEGGFSQRSPKRQRNEDLLSYNNGSNNNNPGEILIKFGNEKHEREGANGNGNPNGYPIISGGMNFIGGGGGDHQLGAYPIGEIGRFETEDFSAAPRFLHGNGISLSLGLPPCENHQQQLDNLSATSHTFMSPNPNIQFRRANEFGSMNSPSSHSSAAAFECIDIQNRKGFATQLLPDFVT